MPVAVMRSLLPLNLYAYAASTLTARLRTLSLKALLRQDIEFFDQEKNSVRISLALFFAAE